MENGETKKIKDICVGDVLYYDGLVTAKIKVETQGSIMYNLNNIIVSNTHLVHLKDKWIRVGNHPDAKCIENYDQPYLYCLNTGSKTIYVNNTLFSDWDETVGDDFIKIINNPITKKITSGEIHKLLDSGFTGTTQIKMEDADIKEIQNLQIGDILFNGEKIYGLVEINGKTLKEQYHYNLGKKGNFKGGANIVLDRSVTDLVGCDNRINLVNNTFTTLNLEKDKYKKILKIKEDKLYHLLTDKQSFYINELKIYDYNSTIDFFIKN
jgi:hypothetical protein